MLQHGLTKVKWSKLFHKCNLIQSKEENQTENRWHGNPEDGTNKSSKPIVEEEYERKPAEQISEYYSQIIKLEINSFEL